MTMPTTESETRWRIGDRVLLPTIDQTERVRGRIYCILSIRGARWFDAKPGELSVRIQPIAEIDGSPLRNRTRTYVNATLLSRATYAQLMAAGLPVLH
jgi:hypothetical protein